MIMRKPAAAPARPQRQPRAQARRVRRVPVWPLVFALLVLAAVVGGIVLASRGGGDPGGATGGARVPLEGVASYDPQGDDKAEHPERVADATDGDPSTYWTTSTYFGDFSKDGVGLVLEAGSRAKRLVLTTDTPGYTAEIRAGSSAEGPFDAVVGPSKTVAASTTWELEEADGRYLVVWITELDRVAHVNEARASG